MTESMRAEIVKLAHDLIPRKEIAARLGIPVGRVKAALATARRRGATIPRRTNRFAPHTIKMIELAKSGLRPKLIAERIGVPKTLIYSQLSTARKRGESIPRYGTNG